MAPVYSHRFFAAGPNAAATYTVPAGYVAVVRGLTIHNDDTSSLQHCFLTLQPGAIKVVYAIEPVQQFASANISRAIDLRLVVNAGEQLVLETSANVFATVSGFLLVA